MIRKVETRGHGGEGGWQLRARQGRGNVSHVVHSMVLISLEINQNMYGTAELL